ncbi:MAG: glycosyltransferase family A protein [Candidatus Bathyarchaeia archaeon]
MPAKILSVITTLKDDPKIVITSLLNQTVKPQRIIVVCGTRAIYNKVSLLKGKLPVPLEAIYVKPNMQEHVGVRVGKAINAALSTINLGEFNYILKLDADIILSRRCLEKSLGVSADLVGLGPFMLVNMKPFIYLLGGKWPETPADDSYICLSFISRGLKYEPLPQDVVVLKKGGVGGGWRYYFLRGVDDYRSGICPLRMFRIVLKLIRARRTLLPTFTFLGYLTALFKRKPFYSFAPIIFRKSCTEGIFRRLKKLKRLLSKFHNVKFISYFEAVLMMSWLRLIFL